MIPDLGIHIHELYLFIFILFRLTFIETDYSIFGVFVYFGIMYQSKYFIAAVRKGP